MLVQDMKKGLEVLTLTEPTFQSLLQNYFLKRLMQQRNVSQNTVSSYRDTFRLFFEFIRSRHQISPSNISIEHMRLEYIEEFCNYLAEERMCSPSTVNNRLSAIKSFLKYVIEQQPEFSNIVKGTLSLPFRKQEKKVMCFITRAEFDVYLSLCDTTTRIGARDKLMFLLLYNTGVRVSELLAIKYSDVRDLSTPRNSSVKIYGKGRKERVVPIWKSTAKYIRKYAETYNVSDEDRLFINKNGAPLTRSGVYGRIEKLTKLSAVVAPSLKQKTITPHSFRHSVAMNLLEVGVDLSTIAIWLGHSSIETTHKYMVADLELKRKAMEKAKDSGNASYKYKPSKDILEFLESL